MAKIVEETIIKYICESDNCGFPVRNLIEKYCYDCTKRKCLHLNKEKEFKDNFRYEDMGDYFFYQKTSECIECKEDVLIKYKKFTEKELIDFAKEKTKDELNKIR